VTREQQALSIEIEARRGRDALRSAEILLASGMFADAVSRAYYGALHFARALLITSGEEPKTHAGVLRLISRDFVRTSKLAPELGQILSALEKQRTDADYTSEMVFTEAAARADVERARRFIDAAAELLARDGWPSV
jgi:uncharacterized protein (UPF0332 family)